MSVYTKISLLLNDWTGLRKKGRAHTLPCFGTSTVEKLFFEKLTMAPRALEKANEQVAEISMRLKQSKHFLFEASGINY